MEFSKDDLLAMANNASKNTLMETLGIEICDVGVDYLVAKMPVNSRVYQPDGILHGGATVALAESVGSFAAHIFIDAQKYFVKGIQISCNHLKSVSSGYIYARADFLHKGRTTQLFDIKVTDDDKNLISVCKLTTITLPKEK
jgi:uncharacterized protein (TIGR00369 family)